MRQPFADPVRACKAGALPGVCCRCALRALCVRQGDEVSYLRYVLSLYKHKLADASARELELERRVSPVLARTLLRVTPARLFRLHQS